MNNTIRRCALVSATVILVLALFPPRHVDKPTSDQHERMFTPRGFLFDPYLTSVVPLKTYFHVGPFREGTYTMKATQVDGGRLLAEIAVVLSISALVAMTKGSKISGKGQEPPPAGSQSSQQPPP